MSDSQTFTATVELNGKTATGIEVPPEVVEALGQGKKPKVHVTVGEHTYRSSVAVMGGRFLIPLSGENRTAAGVAAGDEVQVTLTLDTAPRTVEVPPELAEALASDPEAKAAWDALSFSHQRAHAEAITAAKKPETKANRVQKALEMLMPDGV
jgi:hypothetical protein